MPRPWRSPRARAPRGRPSTRRAPSSRGSWRTSRSRRSPADWTPIAGPVPGLLVEGTIEDDPQARFLLRLPDDWNGKLVVGGASGTRSEHNGDLVISDFVLQKGYAYASQNKGMQNLVVTDAGNPRACALTPVADFPPGTALNPLLDFFLLDRGNTMAEWGRRMKQAALIARSLIDAHYGAKPRRTYAMGVSNGGYQVRKAIEAANFPPDLVENGTSLWTLNRLAFWEVTECLYVREVDPKYAAAFPGVEAYANGGNAFADYDPAARPASLERAIRKLENSGRVRRPLISVHGTLDALIPIKGHARPYGETIEAEGFGENYRLYEVQNGNHLESFKGTAAGKLPSLELIQPHAQRAFELLEAWVEQRTPAPPSQCIPRGGPIADTPAESACTELLVP